MSISDLVQATGDEFLIENFNSFNTNNSLFVGFKIPTIFIVSKDTRIKSIFYRNWRGWIEVQESQFVVPANIALGRPNEKFATHYDVFRHSFGQHLQFWQVIYKLMDIFDGDFQSAIQNIYASHEHVAKAYRDVTRIIPDNPRPVNEAGTWLQEKLALSHAIGAFSTVRTAKALKAYADNWMLICLFGLFEREILAEGVGYHTYFESKDQTDAQVNIIEEQKQDIKQRIGEALERVGITVRSIKLKNLLVSGIVIGYIVDLGIYGYYNLVYNHINSKFEFSVRTGVRQAATAVGGSKVFPVLQSIVF